MLEWLKPKGERHSHQLQCHNLDGLGQDVKVWETILLQARQTEDNLEFIQLFVCTRRPWDDIE